MIETESARVVFYIGIIAFIAGMAVWTYIVGHILNDPFRDHAKDKKRSLISKVSAWGGVAVLAISIIAATILTHPY